MAHVHKDKQQIQHADVYTSALIDTSQAAVWMFLDLKGHSGIPGGELADFLRKLDFKVLGLLLSYKQKSPQKVHVLF